MTMTNRKILEEIDHLLVKIETAEDASAVDSLAQNAHGYVTFGMVDKQARLSLRQTDQLTSKINLAKGLRLQVLQAEPQSQA